MPTAAPRLSSFFTNRFRAALWIVALAGAVALVATVVFGLRPRHHAGPNVRRTLVGAYILRVGRIQVGMAKQVQVIDKQYKEFTHNPSALAKRVPQYRSAERTLALLRRRLGAVDPPREARKLHTLLLALASQNVRVAAAVAGLAAYLPRLASEQAPLRPAILGLRAQVHKARTAKAQAVAFAAYAATTAAVAARIARLPAPSFFVAARNAEVSQLRRLATLATEVAGALAHKRPAVAQKLVAELGQVEASTAVVRAQRAGALAYNVLVKRLRVIGGQIDVERKRLEKSLPH